MQPTAQREVKPRQQTPYEKRPQRSSVFRRLGGGTALRIAVAALLVGSLGYADVVTWNSGWDATPSAGDDVVIADGDLTWDSGAWTTSLGSWTQDVGYADTVTFDTTYSTGLSITGDADLLGGTWTHQANGSSQTYRLDLSIGGSFSFGSGATINADELGYGNGNGPGGESGRVSAGHGGLGGVNNSDEAAGDVYGSVTAPTTLGSGGGGGAGGGAVFLDVGGDLSLEGTISANGQTTGGGGPGAGGSVQLRIGGSVTGSGTVRANGGTDAGGPGWITSGGGGRVGVILTKNGEDFSGFSGTVEAVSPQGETPGGAGTVYRQTGTQHQAGTTGQLIVDNGGAVWDSSKKNTLMPDGVDLTDFSEVVVDNGGNLAIDGDNPLDWENLDLTAGGRADSGVYIDDDAQVVYPENLQVDGYVLNFADASINQMQSVTVGSDGKIEASTISELKLNLNGDLTVQSGGVIEMDYDGNDGRGEPTRGTERWLGGGYGGQGGQKDGAPVVRPTYGSLLAPEDTGSRGDGTNGEANGGRVVTLSVDGTTTVDGLISANGAEGRASGSGGSIFITTGDVAGQGTIQASSLLSDGGRAYGGGGRVSVVLTEAGATFGNFDTSGGIIQATSNGAGSSAGAAGTVYRETTADGAGRGSLTIDDFDVDASTAVTPIPPSEGLEDDLRHVAFFVLSDADMALTDDLRIAEIDILDDGTLDLAGNRLRVDSITADGQTYDEGMFTANDFASVVDSIGGGVIAVPEPTSVVLLALGVLSCIVRRRR